MDAVATAPAGGPLRRPSSRRREIGDVDLLTHVKVNVHRTTVELLPTAYVFNIVHQVQLELLAWWTLSHFERGGGGRSSYYGVVSPASGTLSLASATS